jgi:leucyl-tRNA synthetase
MEIIPNEIIGEFENVFDWLKERACARKSGLGTLLPWDKDWIIESLSDSVIYMTYYIISKYVNTKNLENYDNLIDDSFFDYILHNKKNKNFKKLKDDGSFIWDEEIYKKNNDDDTKDIGYLKSFFDLTFEIKKEFEYYYPLDSRHSGRDLIPNHLSFFIFNHAILFPKKLWPKQIVVNGSVLMDGKKMSKSMGNIIPLRKAIKQYSADSLRVAMLVLGELLQDVDFSFSTLKGIYSKLNEIYNFYTSFYKENKTIIENSLNFVNEKKFLEEDYAKLDMEDKWLLSRINHSITFITASFDKLKIREALNTALYLMDKEFEWYKKRKFAKTGRLYHNKNDIFIIYQYMIKRIKILSPFCPFLSEELWHIFGNNNSIFTASWPIGEEEGEKEKDQMINNLNEVNEHFIVNILNDLNKIIKITKNSTINKIFLYLASDDKNFLYYEILKLFVTSQNKPKNFGEVMKLLLSDSAGAGAAGAVASSSVDKGPNDANRIKNIVKNNTEFIKKAIDDILSLAPMEKNRRYTMGKFNEFIPLHDAISLLSAEFKIPPENILIYKEDQKEVIDPNKKARFSRPFKPAIFIE